MLTRPYNSKSNGGVERSIRSIKEGLRKDNVKKVTQQKIDELAYLLNQHPQDEVFWEVTQILSSKFLD